MPKSEKEGNKEAAIKAFKAMSEACGDAISNAITQLIDGLVVIGWSFLEHQMYFYHFWLMR